MSAASKQNRSRRSATVPEATPRPSLATPPPERPAPDPIDAGSLDEAFVKALRADFARFGASAIAAMREERPTDYVKIVGSLCTKGAHEPADPLKELSDAELDRYIEQLARRAGYERKAGGGVGRGGSAADAGGDAG